MKKMAKKEKEEERVERIIRSLLKLPENRKCINCNSLGPQYVCTTFLTFVCTNCSGVHREFTHRVKSISMAKFRADEVSALQAGGNERARQIYFKDWDPQRNSYPNGSNLHRLRDFIKHVYVDRKYCGDRSHDRLPRLRLSDKEESFSSRSPIYEDRCELKPHSRGRNVDKSLKYYFDERRSPRYAQENSRSGGFRRNPIRFEVVDDRFRDDGIQRGRDSDSHRFSHSFESLSPDGRKNMNMDRPSSPVVRPVKNITGQNAPHLLIGEHSKATDRKDDADASASNQMVVYSSSKISVEGEAVKDNNQNSESLIDFDGPSMSSDGTATLQTQETHQPGNVGNNSHEFSTKQDTLLAEKANSLEFLLYELSVPSAEPACSESEALPLGQLMILPNNDGAPSNPPGGNLPTAGISPTAPVGQMLALPSIPNAPTTASGGNMPPANDSTVALMGQLPTSSETIASGDITFVGNVSQAAPAEKTLSLLDSFDTTTPSAANLPVQLSNGVIPQALPDIQGGSTFTVPNVQQVSNMQQYQLSAIPAADDRSSGEQRNITSDGVINNQPCYSLEVPSAQGSSNVSADQPSQDTTKADQESNSGVKSLQLSTETKSSGRKELPQDLFTASYSSVPGSVPGWQSTVPYGMGYNMQYYPRAMPTQPYPQQHLELSSNPFDLNSGTAPMPVSRFPSMENLRLAIPSASAPRALLPTSGVDTNSPALPAAQAHSYASAMPLQTSPFPSPTSTGLYMGQLLLMNTAPSGPQAGSGFSGDAAFFGSPNMVQQSSSGYPLSSAPSSHPSPGGNPFG